MLNKIKTVRERPRSRPGRVKVGRHRNKMAPHSAGRGRGACGTFTPNQQFLRWSVIWACLLYYSNRHDAARKSADGARGQGLRSQQNSTAFARDLISENGFFRKSFACQTRRSIESMFTKKEKNEKEKKTQGTFNTSFGKHDISAAPHTGQPPTGTAANFCCISCHCRRLSSGHPQGKWNGQTARKRELNTGT